MATTSMTLLALKDREAANIGQINPGAETILKPGLRIGAGGSNDVNHDLPILPVSFVRIAQFPKRAGYRPANCLMFGDRIEGPDHA